MLEATWLTLTSNVVAGAIQEASLRGQIKATEETIRVEIDLLKILKMQQKLGQVTGADVAAQEASLAQAQLNSSAAAEATGAAARRPDRLGRQISQ